MGEITDLVIGDVQDTRQICDDINSENFEWIEAPGLTIEKLETLFRILRQGKGRKKPADFRVKEYGSVTLVRISDELVVLLCSVGSIVKTAQHWMDQDEELEGQQWPKDVVVKLLRNLRALSKKAQKKGQQLFLRVSP